MYDAIVVGACCAGSPTAMLLARKEYHVLLLDKARFPSDTMSGHLIHTSGVALLQRWGLFERLLATGVPATPTCRIDVGPFVLEGSPTALDGLSAMYGPRRTALDTLLADAAVEAGAELRAAFTVHELVEEDGAVVGVRGRSLGGATITERARIVIGADGRHSFVARSVQAPAYDTHPALTCAYYAYWSGLDLVALEVYSGPGGMTLAFPTMDGLALVYSTWPAGAFTTVRTDIEGSFLRALDRTPRLAERVRTGTREERLPSLERFRRTRSSRRTISSASSAPGRRRRSPDRSGSRQARSRSGVRPPRSEQRGQSLPGMTSLAIRCSGSKMRRGITIAFAPNRTNS